MRNEFYIMRPDNYKKGLIELINYIKNNTDVDNISMVEIGAYMGESTIIFSDHFTSVTTIDPYLDNYDENDITCQYISLNEVYLKFLDNTKNNTNIKLIKKTSDDAYGELINERFDFVYIDGKHTYDQAKKDISNYLKLVKPGGFIGGHDYHKNWLGVMNAVEELLGTVDSVFEDTSWIKKI
jgi:predicted O-methyltransferase YrrM